MNDEAEPMLGENVANRRYRPGAQWFHWITAGLIFTVIPLGWIFGAFKTKPDNPNVYVAPFPGTPADYASAHMSVGLVLLVIVFGRIFYRVTHRPPPLPRSVSRGEQAFARLTHGLLYAIFIVMPVSGYLMSAGDKPPIVFLGWFDVPKLPLSATQGQTAAVVHVFSQFAVYGLLALHLAGVGWHLFVRRDDILSRMIPPQRYPD